MIKHCDQRQLKKEIIYLSLKFSDNVYTSRVSQSRKLRDHILHSKHKGKSKMEIGQGYTLSKLTCL